MTFLLNYQFKGTSYTTEKEERLRQRQEPVREYCERLYEEFNGTARIKRGTDLQTLGAGNERGVYRLQNLGEWM